MTLFFLVHNVAVNTCFSVWLMSCTSSCADLGLSRFVPVAGPVKAFSTESAALSIITAFFQCDLI